LSARAFQQCAGVLQFVAKLAHFGARFGILYAHLFHHGPQLPNLLLQIVNSVIRDRAFRVARRWRRWRFLSSANDCEQDESGG
jgi:hypothetical protein